MEGGTSKKSLWGIVEKIVPFFDKYPLCKEGVKILDYVDFCKVVQLIKKEAHLTEEGLNIRQQAQN